MGTSYGWTTVEGVDIIGHRARNQWRLWVGEDLANVIPEEEVWQVLIKAAEESPDINF
jgi:quinate dehydrogenase